MLSKEVKRMEWELEALRRENESLRKQLQAEPEKKPKQCKDCKFFIQHYTYLHGRYSKLDKGHCVAGKSCKDRPADNKKCEYFEFGTYEQLIAEKEAKSYATTSD